MSKDSLPLVCIVANSTFAYGRDTLFGALKYANIRKNWVIHEDLWNARNDDIQIPRCDGAVVAGLSPGALEKVHEQSRFVINCSSSKQVTPCPTVALRDDMIGLTAAEHLLACNLKQFAFYPKFTKSRYMEGRHKAFTERIEQSGYPWHESGILWPGNNGWLFQAHHKELAAWLKSLPKPIGILASDDVAAYDLARCCAGNDISVPDEIAIVGVNNDQLICEGVWPTLTSIEGDFSRVGFQAAELLDEILSQKKAYDPSIAIRLPPMGLVRRASTDILNVADGLLADAIRYIRVHACDPCNVQDVLDHVPISRKKLERQFVEVLGRTPHQEIQRIRLDKSAELLANTDLALPIVAQKSGFSTYPNFNNAFRNFYGKTPAVYRRAALCNR